MENVFIVTCNFGVICATFSRTIAEREAKDCKEHGYKKVKIEQHLIIK